MTMNEAQLDTLGLVIGQSLHDEHCIYYERGEECECSDIQRKVDYDLGAKIVPSVASLIGIFERQNEIQGNTDEKEKTLTGENLEGFTKMIEKLESQTGWSINRDPVDWVIRTNEGSFTAVWWTAGRFATVRHSRIFGWSAYAADLTIRTSIKGLPLAA